jgi:hypothetical protein
MPVEAHIRLRRSRAAAKLLLETHSDLVVSLQGHFVAKLQADEQRDRDLFEGRVQQLSARRRRLKRRQALSLMGYAEDLPVSQLEVLQALQESDRRRLLRKAFDFTLGRN